MRQTLLAVVLLLLLGAPAFAQPDVTGTWTGTATVVSSSGYQTGKAVTLVVSSQDDTLWRGSFNLQSYGPSDPDGMQGAVVPFLTMTSFRGLGMASWDGATILVEGQYVAADSPDPEMLVLDMWQSAGGSKPIFISQMVLTKSE